MAPKTRTIVDRFAGYGFLFACLLFLSAAGCSRSNADNVTNPELVIPDVPPSERSIHAPVSKAK